MSKGIWPAVSGSIAQSERLDVVANNLANVNTSGFKKDSVSFKHILSNAAEAAAKEDIPRRLYKEKDFYRLDGRDKAYTSIDQIYTDHTQGHVKATNASLDVALNGPGFFEVLTPNGVRYSRLGNFRINQDGTLVNAQGHPVLSPEPPPELDEQGNPIAPQGLATQEQLEQRVIRLNQGTDVTIASDGVISQGNQVIGRLGLAEFVDPRLLVKEGNVLYRNDINANKLSEANTTRMQQGYLEMSNVNPVQELTNMLKATRLFEANQKLVKSYGELESQAVRDIGKL